MRLPARVLNQELSVSHFSDHNIPSSARTALRTYRRYHRAPCRASAARRGDVPGAPRKRCRSPPSPASRLRRQPPLPSSLLPPASRLRRQPPLPSSLLPPASRLRRQPLLPSSLLPPALRLHSPDFCFFPPVPLLPVSASLLPLFSLLLLIALPFFLFSCHCDSYMHQGRSVPVCPDIFLISASFLFLRQSSLTKCH